MKTASITLLCLLLSGTMPMVSAQEATRTPADLTTVTLTGYLVDVMCGNAIAKKSNPMTKAARHTRACALAEACAAEGYGMYADGSWIRFDEKGNALANAALKEDDRSRDLYFRVLGRYDGKTLAVISIEPLPAPDSKGASGGGAPR